jgi:uncharacterized protein YndB with AHSA1/START domain
MMLKALLVMLVALVVVILVIVGVGAMLPKSHVVARTITLHQSPEAVFAVMTDFKDAPTWRPDVQSVELLPPAGGAVRFREKSTDGIITYEVVESKTPSRLVTRIADPGLPFGGKWIYEIAPMPGGCRIDITERGEVYNPVFRFVSRFVLGQTRTLDNYLRHLGRRFGENAVAQDGNAAES